MRFATLLFIFLSSCLNHYDFKAGDTVEIINDSFYKGCTGYLLQEDTSDTTPKYYVAVMYCGKTAVDSRWMPAYNLKLLKRDNP